MNRLNIGIIILVFGMTATWVSCKKTDKLSAPSLEAAFVKVIHAAPLTTALDIAFDKDRLYLNFFSYTSHTSYIPVTTGINAFYVFKGNAVNAALSKNLNFEAKKSYSVFIADTGSKMDAVLIRDSTRAPDKDSVRLRFANMTPDGGAFDLYTQDNVTPLATNISYKTASDFISVKAANNITFVITPAGGRATIAISDKTNLVVGNTYTIWSVGYRGIADKDNGKLELKMIRH